DHRTGEVLASVGSPDHTDTARQGFVDMTRAMRSPGSTLKPLVYGLAFDQGLAHPETLIHDGPVSFGRYAPQNFDGIWRGDLRLREALQVSLNIPVIKLTEELGPARVMAALARAGVAAQVPGGKPGLAVSLGGLGVTLEGLTQLYAGLARGGTSVQLRHLMDAPPVGGTPILSDVAAWYLGDILRGIAPPPGAPARQLAFKTGTSYGHRDAWALGWDGAHVAGVWIGRADGTPMPATYGADAAAPVLFEVFARIKPQMAPLPPPPAQALLLGTAALPQPLQRFQPRGAQARPETAPVLTFPPDGAALAGVEDGLSIKLRGGLPPYTLLADGLPVVTGEYAREFLIPRPGPGFTQLVLVDARGHSDRVRVRMLD
ncbi:MAG: penicillin-binding protein 1C, partial [Rhodobacteraceae bacterium]